MISPEIGVVVPVFNRARTILPTLDSIARQTLLPKRLVVVDDGSTDDSSGAVAGWWQQQTTLADMRLVRQVNRGVSAARNAGLALLDDCDYVAFLDSDDTWPDDFLQRARVALALHPQGVAASSDRLFVNGSGAFKHDDLGSITLQPIVWFLRHGAGIASCTLFQAAPVRKLGGFPESLPSGEDTALFLRLSLFGGWLHVPGQPVTFDRQPARVPGEEASLSKKFHDNYRRWAAVYEQFLLHEGGAQHVPLRLMRKLLGRVWYLAGRELAGQGASTEARECYRRSLRWNWRSPRVWCRLTQCLAQPTTPLNKLVPRLSRAA